MTIINLQKSRRYIFSDMLGNEYEGDVPAGEDADNLCCKMTLREGHPFKCVPKIFETSSGMNRGDIMV